MVYKKGSKGSKVKEFQTRLTQWGFPLVSDGIFGNKTSAAVIEFQKAMGLVVDGIVGSKTEGALDEDIIKVTHFKKTEFKCPCKIYCNGYYDRSDKYGGISYALLIMLERIRAEISSIYKKDIPCHISTTGGYRCKSFNSAVGGAKRSYHMSGKAADIYFRGVSVSKVNEVAIKMNPYGGLGLKGSNITHVDVRGYKSRWYYN